MVESQLTKVTQKLTQLLFPELFGKVFFSKYLPIAASVIGILMENVKIMYFNI